MPKEDRRLLSDLTLYMITWHKKTQHLLQKLKSLALSISVSRLKRTTLLLHLADLGNLCSMSKPKSKLKKRWKNRAALGNGSRMVTAALSHKSCLLLEFLQMETKFFITKLLQHTQAGMINGMYLKMQWCFQMAHPCQTTQSWVWQNSCKIMAVPTDGLLVSLSS